MFFFLHFSTPLWCKEKPSDSSAKTLGTQALTILKQAMRDEDSDVRAAAAGSWGFLGNPAAIPVLKEALEDSNAYVRIAAGKSLWELEDQAGVGVLQKMIQEVPVSQDSADPIFQMKAIAKNKARVAAIKALVEAQGKDCAEFLEKFRRDRFGMVQDQVAVSLARLGYREEIPQFTKALKDPDARVRVAGAEALAEIADTSTLDVLKKAASDSSSQVRAAVMRALGALGSALVLSEIREGTKDRDDLVKIQALEALGRIQNPATVTLLGEVFDKSDNPYVQLVAMSGLVKKGRSFSDLSILEDALDKEDTDLKLKVVEVLSFLPGDKAMSLLKKTMADPNHHVQVKAAVALVKRLSKKK
ncbi:MAG: HEAT repeat domain-containing protein [Elusimicrobia bacterium]|nr:HEAT repeat domain-containing protein [Elusimicrobiota bacterium]